MSKIDVLIHVVCFLSLCKSEDGPYVEIQQGALKGSYWRNQQGKTFNGFTGIPFAKPPVKELRFMLPRAPIPWKGTLDASQAHAACPQIDIYSENNYITGNEDCLYLNVYTPKGIHKEKRLPVIFYIHGGSFLIGSARHDWLGPEILMNHDNIILVTTNYRLGALGFLSTADEVAPGNNGLKDQAFALQWVSDNIAQFGGDPKRITVCGNSAGGASAHFHMLSPLTKNLIKGVIAQSGTAIDPFAICGLNEAVVNAQKLAGFLNCSCNSSKQMLDCLIGVNAADIIAMQQKFENWDGDNTISPFRPVVEPFGNDAFLLENPLDIINSGDAADVPLMIGIVSQEGSYKAAGINAKSKYLETFNRDFDKIVRKDFRISSDLREAADDLREFYFGNKSIDHTTKNQLTDIYTDGWYLWGTDKTARLHAKISKESVFLYLFEYRGSVSYSSFFGDPSHDYGVCHTDDLLYLVTRHQLLPDITTDADKRMSAVMTNIWTTFAEYGYPKGSLINATEWEPLQSEALEYYHIKDSADISMEIGLFMNRTQFWRSLPIEVIITEHDS